MDFELLIALFGVVLAAPGALLHWRDLRAPRAQPAVATEAAPPAPIGQPLPPPSTVGYAPAERDQQSAISAAVPLSLPRRFLSALVDTYAVILVGGVTAGLALGNEPQSSDDGSGAYTLGLLLGWLAVSWISSRTGRSPGRLLVGGRLVPVDNAQGRVSFGKTLLRSLLGFALNSLFWLSLWFGLSSSERITLHDRWTATRVVRTR